MALPHLKESGTILGLVLTLDSHPSLNLFPLAPLIWGWDLAMVHWLYH
jgi:hypothetical protein